MLFSLARLLVGETLGYSSWYALLSENNALSILQHPLSIGSDLTLINRGRSGTRRFGGESVVYVCRSPRGAIVAWMDPIIVMESRALGFAWLFWPKCSTHQGL